MNVFPFDVRWHCYHVDSLILKDALLIRKKRHMRSISETFQGKMGDGLKELYPR